MKTLIPTLLIVLLTACSGPRPRVIAQELAGQSLKVTIRNDGAGEGQVHLTARLISKTSGQTAAQAERAIDLAPHETLTVTLTFDPVPAGDYRVEVAARYPPP